MNNVHFFLWFLAQQNSCMSLMQIGSRSFQCNERGANLQDAYPVWTLYSISSFCNHALQIIFSTKLVAIVQIADT